MMKRRTFTDKDAADRFVKARRADRKVASITPVKWCRKTADGWIDRIKYEVWYEA